MLTSIYVDGQGPASDNETLPEVDESTVNDFTAEVNTMPVQTELFLTGS